MDVLKRGLHVALTILLLGSGGLSFAQTPPASAAPSSAKNKHGKKSSAPAEEPFHEDWTTPSLKGSHLIPQVPVLGEKDDMQEQHFIRERYMLQWRPYDPLDLFVVRPAGVAKPPVILYLYSYPQGTDRFKDAGWCATATKDGYAAVGFVSALTEPRIGHHAVKEWFVSELQESLSTSAHDVSMILDYLATRGDLDMDHVGMMGEGSGGAIAILASAAEPRIKAIDVLAPWGDWPDWLAKSTVVPPEYRPAYTTPEFFARVASLDPVDWLPKVKAQSIRIQNIRTTPTVPDAVQEKIETAAPQIAQINQYGDGAALYPQAAGGKLFDWLKEQLKPGATASTIAEKSDRVHYFPAAAKPPRKMLP